MTYRNSASADAAPVECRAVQPALDAVPTDMRDEILRMRETTAGQFALRLFSTQRDCVQHKYK